MRNKTFHKICYEFDLNLKYNGEFRKYAETLGILYINMYGGEEASSSDMQMAKKSWTGAWYRNTQEIDAWLEICPFGEIDNQKLIKAFLKKYRKES